MGEAAERWKKFKQRENLPIKRVAAKAKEKSKASPLNR
jgi:hypothetical protein